MEDQKMHSFAAFKVSLIALISSLILCCGFLAFQAPEKAYAADADKYLAEIEIERYGTVTVELDRKAAPITVDNFVSLARSGFYNGLKFHRFADFCIQGGDPKGNGTGGSNKTIKGEFSKNGWKNPISHKRGVISMARSNDFNSASSQFFITTKDSKWLDGQYAAFGRVVSGMDVIDTMVSNTYVWNEQPIFGAPKMKSVKITPCVPSKGWVKSGKRWWYKYDAAQKKATGKAYPQNEMIAIDGKWYRFDSKGWMRTGWVKSGNDWYYHGSDGAMKTGWQKTGGKWYYMASNGIMQTGKRSIGGETYLLDDRNGYMKTGWSKESGKWYYYKPSGAMYNGILTWVNNGYYLFGFDGAMITGMFDVNKDKYYFDKSTGKMKTGWVKDSGSWYYFSNWGIMQKGWQKVKGKWYYLNPSDGKMKTGFYDVGKQRYYSDGSGAMQTGWKHISGKWYYFNNSGAMQKSKWIGNYYVGADGVMATNTWIGNYHVNASGKWDKTKKAAPAKSTTSKEKASTQQGTSTTNKSSSATQGSSSASSSNSSGTTATDSKVVYASDSKVYHTHNCASAQKIKSPISVTLAQAQAKGLTLCKNCQEMSK